MLPGPESRYKLRETLRKGRERSRPDWLDRLLAGLHWLDRLLAGSKNWAIDYWSEEERKMRQLSKYHKLNFDPMRGYPDPAAFPFLMKQLAKLAPGSKEELAADVVTTFFPWARVVRGSTRLGAKAVSKFKQKAIRTKVLEEFLQESAKAGEIAVSGKGKGRYVEALGIWKKVPEPTGWKAKHKIAKAIDKAIDKAGKIAPYAPLGIQIGSSTDRMIGTQKRLNAAKRASEQAARAAREALRKAVRHSRPVMKFEPEVVTLSKRAEREVMRKGIYMPGVWGMEITRSRP